MIDAELKFGAYVPKVPKLYKDLATKRREDLSLKASDESVHKSNDNGRSSSSYEDCDCGIGPDWTSLELKSCQPYNHDTSLFTFQMPGDKMKLKLPMMGHLFVKAPGCEHVTKEDAVRPYTAVYEDDANGTFTILVKRYKEWGTPEEKQKKEHRIFLFTKTDHSYKPAGAVSNYIHNLKVGQSLEFMFSKELSSGKFSHPLPSYIKNITMIAVGVGIAPMFRLLRHIMDIHYDDTYRAQNIQNIRLLYGARTVNDILLRERLEQWNTQHSQIFRAIYCIGSRWSNIHFAAKKSDQYQKPSTPDGYDALTHKELGWVDADKVRRLAASSPDDESHVVFVCGLPSVYVALVGPRTDPAVSPSSQLYKLGYRDHQVVKL